MKKFILDPKNTLTNVGNSILGFFDVPKFHDSFEALDKILKETNKQKVALILLDGMGKIIFETYKDDIPYLYSHILTFSATSFPLITSKILKPKSIVALALIAVMIFSSWTT